MNILKLADKCSMKMQAIYSESGYILFKYMDRYNREPCRNLNTTSIQLPLVIKTLPSILLILFEIGFLQGKKAESWQLQHNSSLIYQLCHCWFICTVVDQFKWFAVVILLPLLQIFFSINNLQFWNFLNIPRFVTERYSEFFSQWFQSFWVHV